MLWNSGVCYQKGKSLGVAIRAFNRLRRDYAKTAAAKRAIAKLGYIFGKVAWYDRAASHYVDYANRFAGQPKGKGLASADEALSTAVFYFRGIGDDRNAIRNTKRFVARYGRTAPARAADAHYSLLAIYEKSGARGEQVSHLRRYLRRHAKYGGVDRELVANVKLAMLYWRQSCPVRDVMGTCMRVVRTATRARKGPKKFCGPAGKPRRYVVARTPGLVRLARARLRRAVGLWRGGAINKVSGAGTRTNARKAVMIKFYAAARFLLNEVDYERFVALGVPAGLNFDPRRPAALARARKRFAAWIVAKKKLLSRTAAGYHAVRRIRGGGAHYAIASATRIGQMFENFAEALFRAPVPRHLRRGANASERVHAYCSELSRESIPLQTSSVKAYDYCLELSTTRGWFSQYSRACERRLGEIRPTKYPSTVEMFAAANRAAPVLTHEASVMALKR